MNTIILKFLLGSVIFLNLLSCSNHKKSVSGQKKSEKNNVVDSNSMLSKYDLGSESPRIIELPSDLKEISGMTITPDNRLFAHNDEKGIIFQIDMNNGDIIKRFSLGDLPVMEDFEDITYANGKFYLLKSSGDIYEFEEGENNSRVKYTIHKTELNHSNDVEGLCYDPESNSLLLACKGASGTGDNEDKAVYFFSLENLKLNTTPRFLIAVKDIGKIFNPSGIQRHPVSGTFFIIAANGNEIIEISKDGKILGRHELPKSVHSQPEGIAFDRDYNMFISNENKPGNIVVYPYH